MLVEVGKRADPDFLQKVYNVVEVPCFGLLGNWMAGWLDGGNKLVDIYIYLCTIIYIYILDM